MKKGYQKKKKASLETCFPKIGIKILFFVLSAGAGLFYTAYTGQLAFCWLVCPAFVMYGIHIWYVKNERKKIKFYRELEVFVENLQMFYGYYNDMEEAVFDSMVNAGNFGYEFGKKMEKYLQNRLEDREWEECDVWEIQLLKIGSCGMDMETNQMPVQESLRRFKEELREEIFRLEEMRIQFKGLAEVCFFPILAVPVLKNWAMTYLEELRGYYEGRQGFLSALLVLFLTLVVGWLLHRMRFEGDDRAKGKRKLTGEILRFHNWILLQKHSKEINVEKLLEGFLCLSGELKRKVERLHYDYMEKGSEAISRAREEELCMPYVRILEGLLLCDKVSIENAFSNTEMERAYHLEKLKNENRRDIQEKTALGKVLAFLPFYCVSIFFLIIPFVMEGLGRLQAYTDSFGTLLY